MANRVNLGNIIGATGLTGPQGPQGQNGADGLTPYIQNGTWWIGSQDTNVIAKGNEWYYGTVLPTTQGNNGDLYLRTSTDDVYKKESGVWNLITNIKGAKGDKGDKGDTALSVTVGTVTTVDTDTPASITNSGTNTDLVLNFVIPKGETGAKGDKGDTGRTTAFVGGFEVDTLAFDSDPQGQIDGKLNANLGSGNAGKYLQVDSNGNVQAIDSDAENDVVDGYYYSGAFYADGQHTQELVGATGKIYIDVNNNFQYRYNGSVYESLSADLSGYATINYVDGQIANTVAIAEGKTASYAISDVVNLSFNSNNDTITLAKSGTITDVESNVINLTDLKLGDIVLVTETEVPDRWVGSITTTNVVFYKLETSKVDLNNYVQKSTTIAGVDLRDNITTSEMQTALDIVTKSGDETITGVKTINTGSASGKIKFGDTSSYHREITIGGNMLCDYYSDATNRVKTNWADYGNNFSMNENFIPMSNNSYDLGGTSNKWKNLYLSDSLTDGTNSISVANIGKKSTIADYTLSANSWSSKSQTLSIAGKTATNHARVSNSNTGTDAQVLANAEAIADANIYKITDNGTSLTFVCETTPTVDLKIQVEVFD